MHCIYVGDRGFDSRRKFFSEGEFFQVSASLDILSLVIIYYYNYYELLL